MSPTLLLQMVLSVAMSASAQLMLKAGMSSDRVKGAIASGRGPVDILLAVATSPFVIAGLGVFGLSVVVWLAVLAKIEVSQAYPAIALGIAVTAVGGFLIFGEQLSPLRIGGILVIIAGVLIVARS